MQDWNIIFDMDGTLVDTAKATVPACQAGSRDFALPPLEPIRIRQTIGWANPEFYHRLYPDIDPALREEYGEAVEVYEAAMIRELGQDVLFAGIHELLTALRDRGCQLAIASTGSTEHVDISLAAGGIRDFFAMIGCNQPDKVDMVAAIKKTRPDGRWLLIGDKDKDARAARANGITSVGVRYGFGTETELAQFDYLIAQPLDLLELIDRLD